MMISSLLFLIAIIRCTAELQDELQNNEFYNLNFECKSSNWTLRCEKCYLYVKDEKQWNDADYYCKSQGGHLVSIHDLGTNTFLSRFVKYKSESARTVWLGLNDRNEEGVFVWTDGSEALKYDFRWLPDEPKNAPPGEDCVEMFVRSRQSLWNDVPCSKKLPFVCQTKACAKGSHKCDNGNCVPKKDVCDGTNDCGDNSDERSCGNCEQFFTNNTGVITTKGFPHQKYENDLRCSWNIQVEKGFRIELNFTFFDVEQSFDYVDVFDGSTSSSKLIGRYSGSMIIIPLLSSTSNEMKVYFQTDDTDTFYGFRAEYRSVKKECGITEISLKPVEHKYITSPNYPHNYDDDSTCIWKAANTDKFNILTLQILDISMEVKNDFVEIRNGDAEGYLLGKFSGMDLPPPVFSTKDKLWVKFQSDFQNNMRGFKARIHTGCNATYNASNGVISSPGFGFQNYMNLLKCSWMITEPYGRPISFIFHKFDTESKYDVVTISSMGNILKTLSGSKTKDRLVERTLKTTSPEILVTFETDVNYVMAGFNATFSIGCHEIPAIANGTSSGESHYGGIALYKCDTGFILLNGDRQICEYGGRWSKPQPYCKLIDCGYPGVVLNGGFSVQNAAKDATYGYNTSIKYFCYPGYKLNGDQERRCSKNATWSGKQPTCEISICPNPGVPRNGSRVGKDFNISSSVTFQCDEGFNLKGIAKITCGGSGKWSAPNPTCEAIFCSLPTPPANGMFGVVNKTSIPFGHSLKVMCQKGYRLVGNNTIRCSSPGMWKPQLPMCVDVNECKQPNGVCSGNGSVCVNTIGSYRCICKDGFEKVDDFTCKDINECTSNKTSLKCDQDCTNTLGSYKCSCGSGYFLYNGNKSMINQDELRTAIKDHSCYGTQCPDAAVPKNGYIRTTGNRYPAILDVGCYHGYMLDTQEEVKCQKNGTWSRNVFPKCILSNCHTPENVSNSMQTINGNLTTSSNSTSMRYKPGSTVNYICLHGYTRTSGNLVRECTQNATQSFWSGSVPKCSRISCLVPLLPKNGKANYNGTNYGDMLYYVCNGGYTLLGNETSTCQINGKWSGFVPVCAASPCPDPGVPAHGERKGNVALGETVVYSCTRDGYELTGNKSRACVYMGKDDGNKWTGTLPKCIDVAAPQLNCSILKVTLPKFESEMFVRWDKPNVIYENSGEALSVMGPSFSRYLRFGQHNFSYYAVDKAGNKGTCNVIVNVIDVEKPRLRCPRNLVIESDIDVKVFWDMGAFTDNVGVKSVIYSPANGSLFESNKHHRVEATVTDENGNNDTCVMEVYVKGCGCTDKMCRLKPYKGHNQCHISNGLNDNWIISCDFTCENGLSFVDEKYNGVTNHCRPKAGWQNDTIPGCAERKPITACTNITMTTTFNDTLENTEDFNTTRYQTIMRNYIVNTCNAAKNINVDTLTSSFTSNETLELVFQITPPENVIVIAGLLTHCIDAINGNLEKLKDNILNQTSDQSSFPVPVNLTMTTTQCCNNTLQYCCPLGHMLVDTHAGAHVCMACSPGMYHDKNLNKCFSCPVGTYTPTSGHDSCLSCPSDSGTLGSQSTSCLKYCPAGTYSSTGFEPACRKCDYGQYIPASKKSGATCSSCPQNMTTEMRGSVASSQCKELCPPGEISQTGLGPCTKCPKGFYQDHSMKTICKKCNTTGDFAGLVGATKETECPTENPCSLNNCTNNSTCKPVLYSGYACICTPGWTGKYCGVDIDECQSSPCGNRGNCTDKINGFTCNCQPGFSGSSCEVDIDDCRNDTCYNFGVCEDLPNDFKCLCPEGYTGKRCETDIDECVLDPCFNNGTCIDGIASFRCDCKSGYEGARCANETNECASMPCLNNATCLDLVNDYKCNCQPGFTGAICAVNINECVGQPCQNNGTCLDLVNDFQCLCKKGFTGRNCSVNIDECGYKPCLNNGTCLDGINNYTCHCAPGYHGYNCEFETNECDSSPCKQNSTCLDKLNDFHCICPLGFTGKTCDKDIDECRFKPCLNNGSCTDMIGEYRCSCATGYIGRNCSDVIDNCATSPCLNGGNCTNKVGNYTCTCVNGYEGRDCENEINECDPDPCSVNSRNCTDLLDDFFCGCNDGYRGKNCSEKYGYCDPNPCFHGSVCINDYENHTFTCNCTNGYYGNQCQNEIDECMSSPCLNDGSCTDMIADYKCACVKGFTGSSCEINIDDCVNATCQNGGICMDKLNDYACKCPVTHVGPHCEKRIPDEVDISFPGGSESFIYYNQTINSATQLIISVWVRYRKSFNGSFLSIHIQNDSLDPVLSIDEKRVTLYNGSGSVYRIASFASNINDAHWHHIVVNLTEQSSVIIHNEKPLFVSHNESGPGISFFNNPGGVLIVGNHTEKPSGFVGEISQLGIWTDLESLGSLSNCTVNLTASVIPWIGLLEHAGKGVHIVKPWTCGRNVCPIGITGKFCETKIDKIAPNVTFCPPSKKVVTPEKRTPVSWIEPRFEDNVGIVSVKKSNTPGEEFAWGDFVITYVAKDEYGNSAVCSFDLYVTGFNCSELTFTNNSIHACGVWEYGRFCDYECLPHYEVAVATPPFYSCGKRGTWSHGPPRFKDNPDNLLPQCMKTTTPTTKTTNTFIYTTSACDPTFRDKFRQDFEKLIRDLNHIHGICGGECDFSNIRVQCKGGSRRKRRDTSTANSYEVEIVYQSPANSSSLQNLMRLLKENSTSFNTDDASLVTDETVLGDLKSTCTPGSILKDGTCVLCQPGTYQNNSLCQLCPIATYSGAGTTNCIHCEQRKTTLYEGTRTKEDCILLCHAGSELSTSNYTPCQKCDFGYYKDDDNALNCTKCPNKDPVTRGMGSTELSQCEKDAEGAIYEVKITITSMTWNDKMTDRNTLKFRETADNITQAVLDVYSANSSLKYVKVAKLSSGSVVASLEVSFTTNSTSHEDPIKPLRDSIMKGDLSGLSVDAQNYTIDGCKGYTGCGKSKRCSYVNNKQTCVCDTGFFQGTDGVCREGCVSSYCLNGGACEISKDNRVCRCPAEYKGDRCEEKNAEEKKSIWIIVIVVIAVIVFIILAVVCLKRHQQTRKYHTEKWSDKPITDDIEVCGHPMNSIESTPIVEHVPIDEKVSVKEEIGDNNTPMVNVCSSFDEPPSQDNPLAFENKGVELDDEDGKQTSKITVFPKNPSDSDIQMKDNVGEAAVSDDVTSMDSVSNDTNSAHFTMI